jgi:hypothetical protein
MLEFVNMEYTLEWNIPSHVLLLHVSGDVSVEDLGKFNHDMNHYLDEGISCVHLVSIGDNIRRVPTNLMQIKENLSYLQHPKMGWTIIVQEKPNPLTGFIVSVAAQATGMKMHQAKNLEESLTVLNRLDSSLCNNT